jgi:hypothetical protein
MRHTVPVLALLLLAGCQDLTVENRNRPDRDRATQQPTATEAFVSSAFRTWWPFAGHDDYPSWAFSTMAREMTSGFTDFGQLEVSAEPRDAWNNSSFSARRAVNDTTWFGMYRTISTVNDALIAIDSGLVIVNPARTRRSRAVGKFLQGIAHGYVGLYFDRAVILDEHVALDTVRTPIFSEYPEVITAAIEQLDSAIAIAPGMEPLVAGSWLYVAMNATEFQRVANSFAARLMVYSARTPAERAAVDWTKVIARIDAGITADFAPVAVQNVLFDDWKRLISRVRDVNRPSDFGRPNYWLIGPADSSNGFLNWISKDPGARVAFQMNTKDRRIQGTTGPASPGKYFGYNVNDIFQPGRGTYRFSHYYNRRWGSSTTNNSHQVGPQLAMTVTEMDLLKAEGLIRLGRAEEAVPLINKTRVANGELPPVTIAGPPIEGGCVPRKLNGDCGSLWDALRYEMKIEMAGVSGVIAFFNARGWQELPENTFLHLPVPGRELETLAIENYTFGGPGGEFSAPAPNPERCPVALPRCPT